MLQLGSLGRVIRLRNRKPSDQIATVIATAFFLALVGFALANGDWLLVLVTAVYVGFLVARNHYLPPPPLHPPSESTLQFLRRRWQQRGEGQGFEPPP
jgi:hypothetical protein